ncbi:amidohydrolase [Antarcticimicrobium sediminis]|uniref:Amidohydrolase n=1 Tax=Antarcticimicrobium sediminis TaxID=2546227 RepID=A0A4R5EHF8_9RHOB|nr:amidohydrolase [Antarcticimicrobium sediminis]TDE33925.1 amidohydrolase [Antarcticimicrobium sediminis]
MSRTAASYPRLGNADIAELTDWRRELHRHPEVSGEEAETAQRVQAVLQATGPDRIVTGLGGHGVAAVYEGSAPGPRVLLRCELDALPIEEHTKAAYRSTVPGKGHLCGHDGHMAMLAATARLLGRSRPARGSVVLMFQPAEEDGSGAAKVIGDPGFAALQPDFAFAIHNMPGMPLGRVALTPGPSACASRGMRLRLIGKTAHASQPETGLSPMPVLSKLMPALTALGQGGPLDDPGFALATVTHARLGAPAFGIAPGEAELFVTLRSLTDGRMEQLVSEAEALVQEAAAAAGLEADITYEDVFVTTTSDADAVAIASRALDHLGIPHGRDPLPMRPSEDFGRFGAGAELAFLLLGAGEGRPALHNPDYDFPDELIPTGAAIFTAIVDEILGAPTT